MAACGESFEHAADHERVARELARVLRPGGWALLVAAAPTGAGERELEVVKHAELVGELANQLAKAGLQVTLDPYPRRIGPTCAARFGLRFGDQVLLARRGRGRGALDRLSAADASSVGRTVPGTTSLVRGRVEGVCDGVVSGWAWRADDPDHRVRVRVTVDGQPVGEGVAELERRSLADAGIGDGHCAFEVGVPLVAAIPPGRHRLAVEPEGGVALEPAAGFGAHMERESDRWRGVHFEVAGHVVGRVEQVRGGVVCGWVWSADPDSAPAEVSVQLDGRDVGGCQACLRRPSLGDTRTDDGRLGFRFRLPDSAAQPGRHVVRATVNDIPLPPAATFASVGASNALTPAAHTAAPADVELIDNALVEGVIEQLRDGVVSGWAWNPSTPGWRLSVRALVDGYDVAGAVADRYRPALAEAGIGDGSHGFSIRLPVAAAARGRLSLRIEAAGAPLPPAPGCRQVAVGSSSVWDRVELVLEPPIRGRIEAVHDGVVFGWAYRPDRPGWRAALRVLVDGAEVGRCRADLERPDLAAASHGDRACGFEVLLPGDLSEDVAHTLRVETADGVAIPAGAGFATLTTRGREPGGGLGFRVEGSVLGEVAQASDGIVSGWACRPGAPAWPVWVRVIVDGLEACSGVADRDPPGPGAASRDHTRHSFEFRVPALLPETGPHRVLVDAEGVALPPSAAYRGRAARSITAWDGAEFTVDSADPESDQAIALATG